MFAKKDDSEGTDFYYLGKADSSNPEQAKMPGEDGKDVVTMTLSLEATLDEALYDYLITSTGREQADS